MTDRCETCRHWTPPTERTDFRNVFGYISGRPDPDADDQEFGLCEAVTHAAYLPKTAPLPLAVTVDASEYRADLFTQADYGCVLWGERLEDTAAQDAEVTSWATAHPLLTGEDGVTRRT